MTTRLIQACPASHRRPINIIKADFSRHLRNNVNRSSRNERTTLLNHLTTPLLRSISRHLIRNTQTTTTPTTSPLKTNSRHLPTATTPNQNTLTTTAQSKPQTNQPTTKHQSKRHLIRRTHAYTTAAPTKLTNANPHRRRVTSDSNSHSMRRTTLLNSHNIITIKKLVQRNTVSRTSRNRHLPLRTLNNISNNRNSAINRQHILSLNTTIRFNSRVNRKNQPRINNRQNSQHRQLPPLTCNPKPSQQLKTVPRNQRRNLSHLRHQSVTRFPQTYHSPRPHRNLLSHQALRRTLPAARSHQSPHLNRNLLSHKRLNVSPRRRHSVTNQHPTHSRLAHPHNGHAHLDNLIKVFSSHKHKSNPKLPPRRKYPQDNNNSRTIHRISSQINTTMNTRRPGLHNIQVTLHGIDRMTHTHPNRKMGNLRQIASRTRIITLARPRIRGPNLRQASILRLVSHRNTVSNPSLINSVKSISRRPSRRRRSIIRIRRTTHKLRLIMNHMRPH